MESCLKDGEAAIDGGDDIARAFTVDCVNVQAEDGGSLVALDGEKDFG